MKILVTLRDSHGKLLSQVEGNLRSIEEVRARAKSKIKTETEIKENIVCLDDIFYGEPIEICSSCTDWKVLEGENIICHDCKIKFKNEIKGLPKNGM